MTRSNQQRAAKVRPALTAGEMANLLLISERRLQQLVAAGVIIKQAHGRYDLEGGVHGYIKFLRTRAEIGESEAGRSTPGEDKARLLKFRADLAEYEARRVAGELVPVADVERTWTNVASVLRQRLLAIPATLSPHLAVARSPAEINAILDGAIRQALIELSEAPIESESGSDEYLAGRH